MSNMQRKYSSLYVMLSCAHAGLYRICGASPSPVWNACSFWDMLMSLAVSIMQCAYVVLKGPHSTAVWMAWTCSAKGWELLCMWPRPFAWVGKSRTSSVQVIFKGPEHVFVQCAQGSQVSAIRYMFEQHLKHASHSQRSRAYLWAVCTRITDICYHVYVWAAPQAYNLHPKDQSMLLAMCARITDTCHHVYI